MKLKSLKQAPLLIALAAVLIVCLCRSLPNFFPQFTTLHQLEWRTFDWRVAGAVEHHAVIASNVFGAVFVDDTSLQYVNEQYQFGYPWPRFLYGDVIRELDKQGARTIGFDILFAEKQPRLPTTDVKLPDGQTIGSDEYFARRLREVGSVALAVMGEEERGKNLFHAICPADIFATNAWRLAHITSESDVDGVLRRVMPFRQDHERGTIWFLGIELAARELGLDLTNALILPDRLVFSGPNGLQRVMPLNPDGTCYVDWVLNWLSPALQKKGIDEVLEMAKTRQLVESQPPVPYRYVGTNTMLLVGLSNAASGPVDEYQLTVGPLLGDAPTDWVLSGSDDPNPWEVKSWETLDVRKHVVWAQAGQTQAFQIKKAKPYRYYQLNLAKPPGPGGLQVDRLALLGRGASLALTVPSVFRDKVVFIGSVGSGNNISDRGATPLDKTQTFLVSKHWNVANSLLTNRFVHTSPWWVEILLIVVFAFCAMLLTWELGVWTGAAGVLVLTALYSTVAYETYAHNRLWLPMVLPLGGGLIFTYMGSMSYRVIFEQKEQRHIKSVFSKVVSPNIVNELLKYEQFSLGGAQLNMTVFFADVRGFTEMTDVSHARTEEYVAKHNLKGAEAQAYRDEQARMVLDTVNTYLSAISNVIKTHEGTLDKYIGDCVMAFWGAPTANERHAVNCVRAAIDAQRAIYALNIVRAEENKRREAENVQRAAEGKEPLLMLNLLSLGSGINSGIMTAGLMGSKENIVNYTVFGREVNLASRLEGVSGRGRIIIGESTFADLERYAPELAAQCVPQAPVRPKGFSTPIKIYEVPWKEPAATPTPAPAPPAPAPAEAPKA